MKAENQARLMFCLRRGFLGLVLLYLLGYSRNNAHVYFMA